MSNALATQQSADNAPIAKAASPGLVPQNMAEAFRFSEAVVQSGLAPKGLSNPQAVMIAMMSGMELGMSPMQSIQSVAVINGRACIWGDGLIAPVRANPLCLYVKEWTEGEGDERRAYCETQRRGEAEPITRTFGVADARKMGKWGSSGPWSQYPDRMLQMRARGFCLRDAYPDVLKGVYVREEVEDYHEPRNVTPPKASMAQRLTASSQEPQDTQEGFAQAQVHQSANDAVAAADEAHDEDTRELFQSEQSEPSSPDPVQDDGVVPASGESDERSTPDPIKVALASLPVGDRDKLCTFATELYAGSSSEARKAVCEDHAPIIQPMGENGLTVRKFIMNQIKDLKPEVVAELFDMDLERFKELS